MGAAASDHDSLNGGVAEFAGLAGALVDAVLELEEAADAVGVNIVRDGGAAEFDGVAEDGLDGGVEQGQLGAGEAGGGAFGADTGAKEGLVGVDIADSVEEFLVEESGFDGSFSPFEEGEERAWGDGEGLGSGALEVFGQAGWRGC